ncbi:hypothetical protein ACLOJK_036253 [Asimina triloba]
MKICCWPKLCFRAWLGFLDAWRRFAGSLGSVWGWTDAVMGRNGLDRGLDAADLGLDVTWVTDEGFHHRFATDGCRPDEERDCLLVRLKPLIWCSRWVLATAVANRVRRSDLNLE